MAASANHHFRIRPIILFCGAMRILSDLYSTRSDYNIASLFHFSLHLDNYIRNDDRKIVIFRFQG